MERLTVGGLSLDHITVELIESEALREDHRLVGFLDGLHAAGVTVSLDDFGRAYSSLDRLRDAPPVPAAELEQRLRQSPASRMTALSVPAR